MKTSFWLLLALLYSFRLLAQPFTARTLSLQQGLPEYYVSGLVQDKAGFIWVATRDGLARYDGRQFKVFRHQPYNSNSLASNIITSMQSVSDTTMLIEFEDRTLQRLNPVTEQFRVIVAAKQLEQRQLRLHGLTLSADETCIWGRSTTQFTGFDRQTKQVKIYPIPTGPDTGSNPDNTDSPKNQQLYVASPGRVVQFDTRLGSFRTWDHPPIGLPGKIETYYGTACLQRRSGELLISAAQQLLAFDPKTHRFRSIPIPSPVDTQAGLIYEAPDRQVYFTYGMSVYRLSPDNQIRRIWTAPRLDYQNYFHALLLDRSGVLWIGTNGDGIQQIDLKALPIKTYPYRTNFIQDVLGTEMGLAVPPWAKTNTAIYQLRVDGKDPYLSVGLTGWFDLFRGDAGKDAFRSILHRKQKSTIKGIDGGNALKVLSDGTVWMYEPHQGFIKADPAGRLLATYACPTPINWVSCLQPIGQLVWIGSEESGLYGYDLQRRRIVRHLRFQATQSNTLLSDHVQCMAADPADPASLWIGTQNGLSRLDTRTMRCQNWSEAQGLPSGTIHTLLTDRQGNVWFSTGKGISRMNPRTRTMRHFSTADGLLDIEYRPNHALLLADGRIAFGGATGITVFDPLLMTERLQPIPTVLTALKLDNRLVEPGQPGAPLSRPLNATRILRLGPTQNFLSLEFAGLQYNKPTSLQYRYQLTGVDAHWVYVGNQTIANYTQLAPGQYEFRVNAADASGRWSPLVKTIRIEIAPPWWQTGWAYVAYALMGLVLVRAYSQYRINQTQFRQEMALQEQEARLIKANADWQTRFFTNITHEFRTPLTLIINPLERLMETAAPALQQPYGVMHRNAQRLLRLINQLLDIAKLEAGQLSVTESQGNLPAFFAQLVDAFRPRADKKELQLTYEASGLTADYRFDAHKLETIGYNLLANALKFTPAGGHIEVRLIEDSFPGGAGGFQLVVSDTGPGIVSDQLPHIFDRFYQGTTANASAGQGTGIGLFLVAEFCNVLGGSVRVASQPGQGATFIVTLPLKPTNAFTPRLEPLPSQTAADPEQAPNRSAAPATAPLVLVAEDNDELRDFVAGELAGTYRVITAGDGEQGWQLCLTELPDLVISDVMMPVQAGPMVDGFTLVERIKTTPLTAHIAVMLLTAKTMTDSRIQGLSVGANDYLTKPFHLPELKLRIANLLHHQQQLRQHWQTQSRQLDTSPAPGLPPEPAPQDPFLLQTYQVLDQELAQSAFTIEQLADELAVSHRTLNRKLVALTGLNARDLVRSYRLRKAADLLGQGCSVSETAEKTGFESVSHFSRSFKIQFGVSPSAHLVSRRGQ